MLLFGFFGWGDCFLEEIMVIIGKLYLIFLLLYKVVYLIIVLYLWNYYY